jgi:hypothetical protein
VIGKCHSCGQSVSVEESVCPKCGVRDPVPEDYRAKPYRPDGGTRGGCLGIVLLVATAGAIMLGSGVDGVPAVLIPW